MREILVINPARRKKTAKRKKGATMARKKTRKKAKRRTSNPTKPRTRARARRTVKSIKASFMGLNFQKALSNAIPTQIGMLSTKWLAKRFGPDASETDPGSWNYSSYIKGGAGAVIAGMLVNMVRRGWGQKAMEGGLNLMLNKLIQNELIAPYPWAAGQFGEDDDYVPTEYLLTGSDEMPLAFDDRGGVYPASDVHRIPEASMAGGSLEPVGPLGGSLEPVGPLGDAFSRAFYDQA